MDAVAVTSHSFSKNRLLREELARRYPRTVFNETGRPLAGEALIAFLRGHAKAITGLERLDARVFEAVPELRLVSKYGVGLDMIDLDAARRHGVAVRWTPGVNRQAVAELTIAFMIALARSIVPLTEDVASGRWTHPGGRQLASSVVGIIGCGHVGQRVAQLCRAFGASVIANDIRDYSEFYRAHEITAVALERLLRESDFITLHVPLDVTTRRMIGPRELGLMKPSAFVVNTARGGLIDEDALKQALIECRLAGAACDVFESEPPADPELLKLRNFLGTPHIGGGTQEAVLAMGRAAIAGLDLAPESIDVTLEASTPNS
jgi:D-3-phosphoglycerate dehydrogenase